MDDDLKAVVAELERLAAAACSSLTNGRASVKVMAQTIRDGHDAQHPRYMGPVTPDEDAAYIIAACAAVPKLIAALRQRDEALERARDALTFGQKKTREAVARNIITAALTGSREQEADHAR